MIRIRLFCAAGFSTGMLVKKIEEAIDRRNIEADVKACPQGELESSIRDADVALLGPQVAYTLEKSKIVCDKKGIPVGVIPMKDYGLMNGEGILSYALNLIEKYKK